MGKNYHNLSNDDLIKLIINLSNKLNKVPTQKDMNNKNNTPSASYYYKRFNTNSWNEILKMANLELNHFQGHTNESALKKLKEYYKILNRIPTRKDFEFYKWTPSHNFYAKNFVSFENACYLIGLTDKPMSDKERIDFSIQKLKQLSIDLQRCPTVNEYEVNKDKGFSRRVLEKHLNLKYNDICKKYIPNIELNVDNTHTKEELINILVEIKERIGRPPMFKELNKYGVNITYKVFKRLFNDTYNNIIKSLGWEISGNETVIVRDKDKLLYDFYCLFTELKRIPYVSDFNENKNVASYTTYVRYFGNTESICNLLNIDFQENYKGAGAGKITYDNLGNLCKSIPEKDISNFLIENRISFEKEFKYGDLLEGKNKDLRKFDWLVVIGNKKYYIEYFGMYSSNPRGSIGLRYSKKAKKKIKDLYKAGLINQCIFIFPWDIKNRTLEDIFDPILDEINNKNKNVS